MERIRFADDVPICFEVASVPQKLIDGYSKAEITESLYRTLEKKGGKKSVQRIKRSRLYWRLRKSQTI